MNYGIPTTSGGFVAYASSQTRTDFIRKVYSLFFLSVLVTIGVGVFCAQAALLPVMLGLRLPLMIGLIGCAIGLFFARRTSGLNVALFYLFAAIEGALLGPLLVLMNQAFPGIPAQAACLTAVAFGGLSLYAMQSKKDFSYMGGFLFVALLVLIMAGFLLLFFQSPMLSLLYAVGGVLIFSAYILYDTSQIIYHLEPDEAIVGAISLYLDVINLFLFLLRLLTNFSSRD